MDKSAKKVQDSVNSLSLQIGDKVYNYNDLVKYRTHTDAFNVVFPDYGIYGVTKGGPSNASSLLLMSVKHFQNDKHLEFSSCSFGL